MADEARNSMDILMQVEVPISVSLGRTRMRMKDLANLTSGSVVELDQQVGDEVEIRVNELPDRPGRGGGRRRQLWRPDSAHGGRRSRLVGTSGAKTNALLSNCNICSTICVFSRYTGG